MVWVVWVARTNRGGSGVRVGKVRKGLKGEMKAIMEWNGRRRLHMISPKCVCVCEWVWVKEGEVAGLDQPALA